LRHKGRGLLFQLSVVIKFKSENCLKNHLPRP